MEANRGLQMVCEIHYQAPGTLAHERLDDACAAWDSARRRHEQNMHEWIAYPKTARATKWSSRSLGELSEAPEKKAHVLFKSGGARP